MLSPELRKVLIAAGKSIDVTHTVINPPNAVITIGSKKGVVPKPVEPSEETNTTNEIDANVSSESVGTSKFSNITLLVIDQLEGGYYSPEWHSTGDSRYSSSGETMFGIDRKHGGTINTSSAGVEFWDIIDENKNIQVWKWNYKGGALAPELKSLVVEMMHPLYEKFAKAYLTSEAREIVNSDNRLLFHFVYATWNGAGWFKKFASDINKAVASGIKSPDILTNIAIDSRTKEGLKEGSSPNSLIAQGGDKISLLFEELKVRIV